MYHKCITVEEWEMAFTEDDAYARLHKAVLRSRTVNQLLTAIKRDLETLPKTDALAKRSVKVLDYMRGYSEAVQTELMEANDAYREAAYQARRKEVVSERRKARTAA
jgi:hypothetical protein